MLDIEKIYTDNEANNTASDNPATVFDSSNPTPGCEDLGTANQDFLGPGVGNGGKATGAAPNRMNMGNLIIVQEDGKGVSWFINNDLVSSSVSPAPPVPVPNDRANGGTLHFKFREDVEVNLVELIDLDVGESATISGKTEGGAPVGSSVIVNGLGNNGYQRAEIAFGGKIRTLDVCFSKSGGLATICYCKEVDLVVPQ